MGLWKVVRRASWTGIPDLTSRKQEASRCGQVWLEQLSTMMRTGSRSAFAKATVPSAFARGAKPGNAITDVPNSANIAKAVRDLIIWGC